MKTEFERRRVLQAVAGLAGTAAMAGLSQQPASAQQTSGKPMTDGKPKTDGKPIDPIRIIDFHSHHIPARFELTAARTAPPTQRARWETLARTLSDEDFLLKDIRDGHLSARVVSILIQLIAMRTAVFRTKPQWP